MVKSYLYDIWCSSNLLSFLNSCCFFQCLRNREIVWSWFLEFWSIQEWNISQYDRCIPWRNGMYPKWVLSVLLIGNLFLQAACTIRVPVEVIKQRAQSSNTPTQKLIKEALQKEGLPGLYRGFLSSIARDIPFALIQLPLWEYAKRKVGELQGRATTTLEASLCGSLAGFTAAVCTNPIDVAKTRIMLARNDPKYGRINFFLVIRYIFEDSGFRG